MSGISNLYDACDELLGVASQACALAPGGAMQHVFVSPGPPAWDCPNQLTVHAGTAVLGDTAPLQPPLQPMLRVDTGGVGRQVNLAALTITALRCVPTLQQEGQTAVMPDPADSEQAARVTLGDLWAIWNHIATLKRQGVLFPPHSREMIFDPAVPLAPLGGIGGWQVQVRVQVDGFATNVPQPQPAALVWSYNGGVP